MKSLISEQWMSLFHFTQADRCSIPTKKLRIFEKIHPHHNVEESKTEKANERNIYSQYFSTSMCCQVSQSYYSWYKKKKYFLYEF